MRDKIIEVLKGLNNKEIEGILKNIEVKLIKETDTKKIISAI